MPDVLEVLNEECPYDMEPGEYWVLLRELYEGMRKPTVVVFTNLYFKDNGWYVTPVPTQFIP